MPNNHNVSVRIGEKVINRWLSYSIANDMLTDADAFSLAIAPGRRDIFDLVPPDSPVEVRVDDVPILSGFIDERGLSIGAQGSMIEISGRDKMGRLVDESANLVAFGKNLNIETIAADLAAPTFPNVSVSNAENRDLVRGQRSGKAPANSEPIFAKASEAPKKIEPGESRLDVLRQFLEPARLLAWGSADGETLIVGLPNYTQGTQFRFFMPKQGSTRSKLGNILSATLTESVANRYSTIRITGASRGDDKKYGSQVTRHTWTVNQGPGPGGIGGLNAAGQRVGDFFVRKQLIISDDEVKSRRDARERALRELAHREAERQVVEIQVQGHSQRRNPSETAAIYTFDTMAELELEEVGIKGRYLITAVTFTATPEGGELANIKLVPEGTELVS